MKPDVKWDTEGAPAVIHRQSETIMNIMNTSGKYLESGVQTIGVSEFSSVPFTVALYRAIRHTELQCHCRSLTIIVAPRIYLDPWGIWTG